MVPYGYCRVVHEERDVSGGPRSEPHPSLRSHPPGVSGVGVGDREVSFPGKMKVTYRVSNPVSSDLNCL